jgi:hypothetical protein
MTLFGRLLIACVLLSLCAPAAAGAATSPTHVTRREFPPPDPREFVPIARRHEPRTPLTVALEKASQLWGAAPCGGHYRVELTTLPPEARGRSIWREPATSLGPYTTPSRTWTECVIQLSTSAWSSEGVASEWPDSCSLVLHEWGHLTGHSHADEPGEPPEPPGMTQEQLEVMRSAPPVDLQRCGWEP